MQRDAHVEVSELLLAALKQNNLVDFCDVDLPALANSLSERVLKPWLWSPDDVERKVQVIWDRHKDYYRKRRQNEQKAKTEIRRQIELDGGLKIGVFYFQKSLKSVGMDLLDFLFDLSEIHEVYAPNQEVVDFFAGFLDKFTPKAH